MNILNLEDNASSSMIEYIIISGILMVILVITMLALNSTIIEQPINQLSESQFIDIGNGISTRIVDLYVIAPYPNPPSEGNIVTYFDIPDEVAGRQYLVTVSSGPTGDQIAVSRGSIMRKVSLAGIGNTLGVGGSTTGEGLNKITYTSEGL